MIGTLARKLVRDVRLPLLVLTVLLGAFECLWTKVIERLTGQLLPQILSLGAAMHVTPQDIENTIFEGPGKFVKAMIGGENISLFRTTDMLTVGYMHVAVLAILCLWAVGRAAGAIAGELDRGTMELLLAQPLARYRVVVAHLCVDCLAIPILCLGIWAGNWIGIPIVGLQADPANPESPLIDPRIFGPALWNVAGLVFAISGYTIWLSALGRFRGRVLGIAILVTLLQYLINVIGQLWDVLAPLRPLTVFYYYQPQQIILRHNWQAVLYPFWNGSEPQVTVHVLVVLFGVGIVGYLLALWTFTHRDLPAPL
jgi:ABC-2 type transport system permease protein